MSHELALIVGMFTTLLAIINPLEALPVFLRLLEGKDAAEHRRIARLQKIFSRQDAKSTKKEYFPVSPNFGVLCVLRWSLPLV